MRHPRERASPTVDKNDFARVPCDSRCKSPAFVPGALPVHAFPFPGDHAAWSDDLKARWPPRGKMQREIQRRRNDIESFPRVGRRCQPPIYFIDGYTTKGHGFLGEASLFERLVCSYLHAARSYLPRARSFVGFCLRCVRIYVSVLILFLSSSAAIVASPS